MNDSQLKFLQALKQACNRSEELGSTVVPRAIYSWLSVAALGDFEGEIPGVSNSYLHFQKSDDWYTGSVSIGDSIYTFDQASIYQVASAVAVSIGADLDPHPDLRDLDIARLGKSIDLLVKARVLRKAKPKGSTRRCVKQTAPNTGCELKTPVPSAVLTPAKKLR